MAQIEGNVDDRTGSFVFYLKDGFGSQTRRTIRIQNGEKTIAVFRSVSDQAVAKPLDAQTVSASPYILDGIGKISVVDEDGVACDDIATAGVAFELLEMKDQATYYKYIQLASTRLSSPIILKFGSKRAYDRFDDFPTACSALTVFGHRLIEDMLKHDKPLDAQQAQWFSDATRDLLLTDKLPDLDTPSLRWDYIRWAFSLCTVAATIAIARNENEDAERYLRIPCRFHHLVARSKVSALNIANAFLVRGLLLLMEGDRDEARACLRSCLTEYPAIVNAQDMLENVWVIGDLINCARTARQAFIALNMAGLGTRPVEHVMDQNSVFDMKAIQAPIGRLMTNGYCRSFSDFLAHFQEKAHAA